MVWDSNPDEETAEVRLFTERTDAPDGLKQLQPSVAENLFTVEIICTNQLTLYIFLPLCIFNVNNVNIIIIIIVIDIVIIEYHDTTWALGNIFQMQGYC